MIVISLVMLAVTIIGALIFKLVKPEAVTTREIGRCLMWAGLWGLVFTLAAQRPALLFR
jgi:hypothetical protein